MSDQVPRVPLRVLDRTESAANEDSDAGSDEDPEERAPVVDEGCGGGVEAAEGEGGDGGTEVREAGATATGGEEKVSTSSRRRGGGGGNVHSVGKDDEEDSEQAERDELDDQTGERNLRSNLGEAAFRCGRSASGGLDDKGDDVAPAVRVGV